jgi:hypothetical protein
LYEKNVAKKVVYLEFKKNDIKEKLISFLLLIGKKDNNLDFKYKIEDKYTDKIYLHLKSFYIHNLEYLFMHLKYNV